MQLSPHPPFYFRRMYPNYCNFFPISPSSPITSLSHFILHHLLLRTLSSSFITFPSHSFFILHHLVSPTSSPSFTTLTLSHHPLPPSPSPTPSLSSTFLLLFTVFNSSSILIICCELVLKHTSTDLSPSHSSTNCLPSSYACTLFSHKLQYSRMKVFIIMLTRKRHYPPHIIPPLFHT